MVSLGVSKKRIINLGSNCDMGCNNAKDLFYGKIYCKKYGWVFKTSIVEITDRLNKF